MRLIAPPRCPLLMDRRAANAPARPASAAPPASRGVFARLTALPTVLAADSTVLWPFREREVRADPLELLVLERLFRGLDDLLAFDVFALPAPRLAPRPFREPRELLL